MKAKQFLENNVAMESREYFGVYNEKFIRETVNAWMNDKTNSKWRFDEISELLPGAKKILDLAAGCGTAVYYGLLNGFDMWGIEPETWKLKFLRMKMEEYRYPPEWLQRFSGAKGEYLPFKNDSFDCVTSYQTLEHIKDIYPVIKEMIRVTKVGGVLHLKCPDYMGTFEEHYWLPWLPLFPKILAKFYLKLLKRPIRGLDYIFYPTKGRITKCIIKAVSEIPNCKVRIIDLNRERFKKEITNPKVHKYYMIFRVREYIANLFKTGMNTNIFVRLEEK